MKGKHVLNCLRNAEKTCLGIGTGTVYIMNLGCIQSQSLCVLWRNPGSKFEPMLVSKCPTRKHLILSFRKHLLLSPIVSKAFPTACKITPEAKRAGRNGTKKWVTREQNGLVSQHHFVWAPLCILNLLETSRSLEVKPGMKPSSDAGVSTAVSGCFPCFAISDTDYLPWEKNFSAILCKSMYIFSPPLPPLLWVKSHEYL